MRNETDKVTLKAILVPVQLSHHYNREFKGRFR